ncbi:hypothetical protein ABH15_10110 [Methanoculleus taiwanensis]|uniref:LamG-like jellyroll fold domain-containing protein n=1 Tax=Methanoculleus taiwanensis TaxID=1550565 RepID=A0A498H367_9EURY|nr:LamG-like jellyroll fold domain-containing protein [Methanoculleus taiwanensis]RXE56426.1 hypothetical protein ABH15_10110 [Methanoculleus taiwanensis]
MSLKEYALLLVVAAALAGHVSAIEIPLLLFEDSFETGTFENWDEAQCRWRIGTDSHTGEYAAACIVEGKVDAPGRALIKTLDYTGSYRVEGWFKTTKLGTLTCSSLYILGEVPGKESLLYSLQVIEGGRIGYNQRNESGKHCLYSDEPVVRAGQWHRFAVCYDRDASTQSVWIDGRYLGTSLLRTLSGEPVRPDECISLRIGGGSTWGVGDEPDIAIIDDIRVTTA